MKLMIALAMSLGLSLAAETPKAAPKTLTAEQKLRLENVALKQQLLQAQADKLTDEQNGIVADACKGAGIDVKECSIDPRSGTITKREQPAETKPEAKQ